MRRTVYEIIWNDGCVDVYPPEKGRELVKKLRQDISYWRKVRRTVKTGA